MKALVISDIHGNIDGLNAVWNAEKDSDMIICIGDMVDVGYFGDEVVRWMMDHRVLCVRGNHDDKFINYADRLKIGKAKLGEPYSPISYAYSKMSPEEIDFLRKRPATLEVHIDGHLYGLSHKYTKYKVFENDEEYEKFSNETFGRVVDRMIFGHTHFQHVTGEKYLWMNPGSVCYNRGKYAKSLNSYYITIEDGQVELKNVEYDVKSAYEKAESLSCMSDRYFKRIKRLAWKTVNCN
jgi:putative phosphoesterase